MSPDFDQWQMLCGQGVPIWLLTYAIGVLYCNYNNAQQPILMAAASLSILICNIADARPMFVLFAVTALISNMPISRYSPSSSHM